MNFDLSLEQKQIKEAARKFAQNEFSGRAAEFDREERFDLALWKKACEVGMVGVHIAEAYGGMGLGNFEHSLICEEFWAVDPGCAQATLSSTFGAELLLLYGSEEQKQQYLPPLVRGEAITGTAITEPNAGSDVTMATTKAVKDGDEWVINGTKMFITNGTIADFIMVFAQTDPQNPNRHHRYSFFVVETSRPGFEARKIRGKLGVRASDTAELVFTELRVPANNLVGQAGQGFKELMDFFNHTRIQVAAQGVGLAQGCLEEALRYTKERIQFGQPLAEFQATQFKLAEMATKIQASRNLVHQAAVLADKGALDHSLVAMAKWFAARTAVECADEALQMHGGYGYIDEFKVQRLYRDAKILEIYEGTKEIEKAIVAKELLM